MPEGFEDFAAADSPPSAFDNQGREGSALQPLSLPPRSFLGGIMAEHRIEEADGNRPAFCSRCGTADADELEQPCPAISDGEMYKLGNNDGPR